MSRLGDIVSAQAQSYIAKHVEYQTKLQRFLLEEGQI